MEVKPGTHGKTNMTLLRRSTTRFKATGATRKEWHGWRCITITARTR